MPETETMSAEARPGVFGQFHRNHWILALTLVGTLAMFDESARWADVFTPRKIGEMAVSALLLLGAARQPTRGPQ